MSARWLALHALRHRLGQSVVLGLLSMTAIAACAAGPLYERAVEQAAVRSQLSHAGTADRGVTVQASSAGEAQSYLPVGSQRAVFGSPVAGVETNVSVTAGTTAFVAIAAGRDDLCAHLRIVQGSCPSAGAQVLLSTSSARAFKLAVGSVLTVTGHGGSGAYPIGRVRIVGLYQPFDAGNDYWFDRAYSTTAGIVRQFNGDAPDILHSDSLLTGPAGIQSFEAARAASNVGGSSPFQYLVDLPVSASRIGVEQSHRLVQALVGIQARIDAAHPDGDPLRGQLTSKLGTLLSQAETGRHQSRVIIPTLAVQLALVVLVVLGLVLAVGIDQRRPELALARLRGQSRAAAARLYIVEIAGIIVVAILPGLLLAWLGCELLCHWWLPDGVGPELRWPMFAAGIAVAAVELLLAVVLARRAAAAPIGELLRSVPPRRSGRGVGVAEAAVGVAATAGVVVAVSGDRTSTVSLLAPSLIAILAGLLLSRALLALARLAGRRALWRGRLAIALAALQAARRPGFRRVVTLVCVAVALLVSSVDQWSVSGENRQARAAATVGAAVVLEVNAPSAAALQSTVVSADPLGTYAMPVIIQRPDGGDTPVIAVDHQRLRAIADWGSSRDTPDAGTVRALVPAAAPAPIRLSGTQLRLRVADVSLVSADPPPSQPPLPVSLSLRFQLADGSLTTATLPVATGPGPAASNAPLGGCASGCTLDRIQLVRSVGDFSGAEVSLRLLGLQAGTESAMKPVSLGSAGDWQNSDAAAAAAGTAASISFLPAPGGALTLQALSHGSGATLQHLDVPVNLPCLIAGSPVVAATPGAGVNPVAAPNTVVTQPDSSISMHGIDGGTASCQPAGTIAFVPKVGSPALITDLALEIASSQPVLTNSSAEVWLGRSDPVREGRLIKALAAAGITVLGRFTSANQQSIYDQSPPAWSIRAALATAVLAALIAALMVVIAAFTSERARSYDLASLRLVGIGQGKLRRAVLIEQLAGVLFALVLGSVVGVFGARLALPAVPLFVSPAALPRPRYDLAWTAVSIAVCAALILLILAAFVGAFVIGRRVSPDRLREGAR
jgi:putative ABC transport system permease protein